MKMTLRHTASTIVLAFLCTRPAAALTTFGGIRQTDGVVNAAMLALLQHDKPSSEDLEQVAGQLAQLAAAKINGGQIGMNATAIADAISNLVTTLKTEAQNAVGDTQRILDGLFSAIGQCAAPSDSQTQIDSLVNDQTSKSTTHITCQSNLQSLTSNLASCNALVAALTAQRDTACQLVLDGSLAPSPDSAVCQHANGETYKVWVVRLAGYFDTAKTRYVEKEQNCLSLRNYVTSNTSRCGDLQTGLNNKQQTCDLARTDLNTAGCALANTQASVCHNYNCCYSDTTDAYTVARTNAENEEIAFVAQWKALVHIECLLNIMVQADVTTEKINNCLTESVSTAPVELSFQTVPSKLPCTLPTEYPCVSAWNQQHQIGDTCVACQGIEDSTTCGSPGGTSPGGPSGPSSVATECSGSGAGVTARFVFPPEVMPAEGQTEKCTNTPGDLRPVGYYQSIRVRLNPRSGIDVDIAILDQPNCGGSGSGCGITYDSCNSECPRYFVPDNHLYTRGNSAGPGLIQVLDRMLGSTANMDAVQALSGKTWKFGTISAPPPPGTAPSSSTAAPPQAAVPVLFAEGGYCCPSTGCRGTPNDGGPWDRFWTERPNSEEECGQIVKAKYPAAVYFMYNKRSSSISKMCQVLIVGNDNCDVMGTHVSFNTYKFEETTNGYFAYPNYCVHADGTDAAQDGGHMLSDLTACASKCDSDSSCTALELYEAGWKGKNCYLFRDAVAKGSSGAQWRDAKCYVKVPGGAGAGGTLLLASTLETANLGDFSSGTEVGSLANKDTADYRIGKTGAEINSMNCQTLRMETQSGKKKEWTGPFDFSKLDNIAKGCNKDSISELKTGLWWHGGGTNCFGSQHFGLATTKDVLSECTPNSKKHWGHFHRGGINTGIYMWENDCFEEVEGQERFYLYCGGR